MKKKRTVHHHFLYYAVIGRTDSDVKEATRTLLEEFLSRLVAFLDMQNAVDVRVEYDEPHTAWLARVVSSRAHAIVHYYLECKTIHVDLYSTRPYDKEVLKEFFSQFWKVDKVDFLTIHKHGRSHIFPKKI